MGRKNRIQMNAPVRFLAVEWREDWEFDHPSCLLLPVVRYSPNGDSCEQMIEDAAIDIALDLETGKSTLDEIVSREFEWRGWSLDRLRTVARQALRGRQFPMKAYRAVEQSIVFERNTEGEVEFREVPRVDSTPIAPPEEAK